MNKTEYIRARIEPSLKHNAENVLAALGITPTQAVTMLYKQIEMQHAWPFELKIPNEETKRALDETDKGIGLIKCKSPNDMFEKLGI